MNGFLNLLKPPGMTSNAAVVKIRKSIGKIKVGHAGTLDPEAAGVLPIMIGGAARLFDVLTEKQKAYIAVIGFGAATDTQDAQGTVVRTGDTLPTREEFEKVIPQFVGDILQTPPVFSALKIDGRPAYERARDGEEIEMRKRPARVDEIKLLDWMGDSARILVRCGRGVYIRTLCQDLGDAAGCPAHMRFLLRIQSGSFSIDRAVTLEEWENAENRQALLMKLDEPLSHLPKIRVSRKFEKAVRNGNPLYHFEETEEAAFSGGPTRVYMEDTFAGLARWQEEERAFRFSAMLMETGDNQ